MPVVLRKDGYRFYFFSNEGNEPPHIHVAKGGAVAKFFLRPIRLVMNEEFKPPQLRCIVELLEENELELIEAWNEYHH